MMKNNKVSMGILAHVDAGKTTLSEILLYQTGQIKTLGRVDHQNAFLDTYALERMRGITIFSKQAVMSLGDLKVTLLDTPGHIDFSAEMERTLQVLDYGILVVNGMDGIQSHTLTLWKLLERYHIPVFIFVNKMDQEGTQREALLTQLEERLSEECIDFGQGADWDENSERMAMSDEWAMEKYIEYGTLDREDIQQLIGMRKIFPVYFGSALKNMDITSFIDGLGRYMKPKKYPDIFGARIYKISRDTQGKRLTHMKITGGSLQVKGLVQEEKVDEIRIYSGEAYENVQKVEAGTICAVTGLATSKAGQGLGVEAHTYRPYIEPVLNYRVEVPLEYSITTMLQNLKELEEEEPHLNVVWNESLEEIHVKVMGEIEIEILRSMIQERYGVDVTFGTGELVYKEWIKTPVIGVGHFEPLRHYAEVHFLIEPLPLGSGIEYCVDCSEDDFDKQWQRLVMTHVRERNFAGVLVGGEITDVKITLVAGQGHLKHTEGGDFRQATYRAIRQGLMEAESVLLEPVYAFRLELPKTYLGRALSDVERMSGQYKEPEFDGDWVVLSGRGPVKTMMNYPVEVLAYTKGLGRCLFSLDGYEPCHNQDEIILDKGYDPELDPREQSGSIFCKKGAGFHVPWNEVKRYMHIDTSYILERKRENKVLEQGKILGHEQERKRVSQDISHDEIDQIMRQTYGEQKRRQPQKVVYKKETQTAHQKVKSQDKKWNETSVKTSYLLVDGYNIIFAWDKLKNVAGISLEGARIELLELLSHYGSQVKEDIIVVFDAYRVAGNIGEIEKYKDLLVVYTKEAETADQYIERFVEERAKNYVVTVATSDVLEQVIIMGRGARRISAQHFQDEVERVQKIIRERIDMSKENIHTSMAFEMRASQRDEQEK